MINADTMRHFPALIQLGRVHSMGTMVAMSHVALQQWLPCEQAHRLQPKFLNTQGPPLRCSDAMCTAAALTASFRRSGRQAQLCRAASEVEGPGSKDFDLSQYVEAKVFESEAAHPASTRLSPCMGRPPPTTFACLLRSQDDGSVRSRCPHQSG